MQSSIITLATMVGLAFAMPATLETRGGKSVCPSLLYSNAQCCDANVLDLVDLNCKAPASDASVWEFKSSCTSGGQEAMCCTIPLAELGVLCLPVVG